MLDTRRRDQLRLLAAPVDEGAVAGAVPEVAAGTAFPAVATPALRSPRTGVGGSTTTGQRPCTNEMWWRAAYGSTSRSRPCVRACSTSRAWPETSASVTWTAPPA